MPELPALALPVPNIGSVSSVSTCTLALTSPLSVLSKLASALTVTDSLAAPT